MSGSIRPAWRGSAEFSPCGEFRTRLDRWWSDEPRALVGMCNPSHAGADKNDPTVWRLFDLFQGRAGIGGFTVVNFESRVATSPADLYAWRNRAMSIDPDGHHALVARNLALIRTLSAQAALRFVAWGALVPACRQRRLTLEAMALDGQHDLYAFDLTDAGEPKHPAARGRHRIPNDITFPVWRRAQASRHAPAGEEGR